MFAPSSSAYCSPDLMFQKLDILHQDFRCALHQRHIDASEQAARQSGWETLDGIQTILAELRQSFTVLEKYFHASRPAASGAIASLPDPDRTINACVQQIQNLQRAVQETAALESPLPPAPSSINPLGAALLSALAFSMVMVAFVIALLISAGAPLPIIAQATASIALCFIFPSSCAIYSDLSYSLNNSNEPARPQSSVQSEPSEKSSDQYYEHALNAFTQALQTDLVHLKDYFEHQLQAQKTEPKAQSSIIGAISGSVLDLA